jgi:hypothetical protein
VESKDKSMLIIFFNIKGIVQKEFVMADQTVDFAYCCDVLRRLRENLRRLRPEIWGQNNWLLHHNNAPHYTSFFTRKFFFYQEQYNCRPQPTLFFSVSVIEDKTERPPLSHN